jgi:hypothetical protein
MRKYFFTFLVLCCGTLTGQVEFPLHISDNQRYLIDQQKQPFPILGRTSWAIISQSPGGYKSYIENTLSHGFNTIEMAGIFHWKDSNHPPFNGAGDFPFLKRLNDSEWDGSLAYKDTATDAPDFTTPNEKYWQYLDTFLNYCESKGILVLFFPAYVGYPNTDQGWMTELVANGPQKIHDYGKWIAERYRNQKNIVWMLLGDDGKYDGPKKEVEAALIAGLKSGDGQQSILYTAESKSGQNARDQEDFGHEMNINGVYTWDSIGVPHLGRRAYSQQPVMPAFLLEEPYDEEGRDGNNYNPHATQPVRRFEWWGWLTTTGGYVAGNGFIWPFIDPYWKQHLDTKAAHDMRVLNTFIQSIEWWRLVPSGLNGMKDLITDGAADDSSSNFIAAAATVNGDLLVAYVPPAHAGTFSVDLSALKDKVFAYWLDPSNGKLNPVRSAPFSNAGTQQFATPRKNASGYHDWVLILKTKR